MMKKLNDLVAMNLKWKLISLVSAFILWIFVMWQTDPQIKHTLSIPLAINNINHLTGNDLVILNQNELFETNIIVNLRAKKSSINNLSRNRSNLSIFIDVRDIDLENYPILGEPIKMDLKHTFFNDAAREHITVLSINPSSVNVILDDVITREFKITLDRTGYVHENFVDMLPVISPETVILKGNRTMVDSVKSVHAMIDLQGQKSSTNIVSALKVLNYEENDITDKFELSTKVAEVFVPIYERKEVPVEQPNILGSVKDGYVISSVTLTPSYVEVIGDSSNIVGLNKIVLGDIDITELETLLTRTYDITSYVSGYNLNIRNGTPHEVKVVIDIAPMVIREVLIPTENILNIGSGIEYGINSEYVVAVISGSEKDLDDLDVNELPLTVDLSGYEEGEYLLNVEISLPKNSLAVVEAKPIDVSVFGKKTETPDTQVQTEDNDDTNKIEDADLGTHN